jgi:hypothetical protein
VYRIQDVKKCRIWIRIRDEKMFVSGTRILGPQYWYQKSIKNIAEYYQSIQGHTEPDIVGTQCGIYDGMSSSRVK